MDFFLILQILFDAVLLFGLLFLFHYATHQTERKKEEEEALRNLQVQEMKEDLQELLMTLKQLGKEVSEDVQEQAAAAEAKSESLRKLVRKLQRDLDKTTALAEEVAEERRLLEGKLGVIRSAKRELPALASPETPAGPRDVRPRELSRRQVPLGTDGVGFSSQVVREVYRLADQDQVLQEIVRRTRLSRAEVQLILNLRGNRFTTPN